MMIEHCRRNQSVIQEVSGDRRFGPDCLIGGGGLPMSMRPVVRPPTIVPNLALTFGIAAVGAIGCHAGKCILQTGRTFSKGLETQQKVDSTD